MIDLSGLTLPAIKGYFLFMSQSNAGGGIEGPIVVEATRSLLSSPSSGWYPLPAAVVKVGY